MKSPRMCLAATAVVMIVCSVPVRAYGQTPDGVTTNVTLWDTGAPLGETIDLADRKAWKVVPPDLLQLEADPRKASSDPGYYGREYEFQGDAIVENSFLTAVAWSAQGKVVVLSENARFEIGSGVGRVGRCTVLQNTSEGVTLEVPLAGADGAAREAGVLTFDKTPIVEIRPAGPQTKTFHLLSPMAYAVAPDFIGDDLVLAPGQYPSDKTLTVPCENFFLGLLAGESSVLVMTWPKGKQQVRLGLEGQEGRRFESIDFDNNGQGIYLALLDTPGIWHREPLGVAYLEKEVASSWKKPFPARWVTPLWEGDVRTTYTFREAPGAIWRGVAGHYNYPIWFQGDQAFYRLSKKVLPKGESIVYFLEGQDTPASVWTPVDILKATLGRQSCDSILDVPGRKLRTHHRRGAAGIRRACTCGGTDAIEAVFKAGQEIEKKEYIQEAVADMVFFVTEHMRRLDEYRTFADEMLKFLRSAARSQPDLKTYIEGLIEIVQRIGDQYEVQKENIKTLEYTEELSRKTLALLQKKDPKNLPTCLALGKDWRSMGGAQDGVLAEYHVIVRKLFQEAGYGCVNQPQAVELGRAIRSRCRQCLRNPDGYEIWPNY